MAEEFEEIIDQDQTGTFIVKNIILIYNILYHTKYMYNNIIGLLMLIDFKKAFDTL